MVATSSSSALGCWTGRIRCMTDYPFHCSHAQLIPLDSKELQRIVTRCLEMLYSDTASNTGLQMECNYLVAVRATENQLLALREEWAVYIE
jgi:hypothetical protein